MYHPGDLAEGIAIPSRCFAAPLLVVTGANGDTVNSPLVRTLLAYVPQAPSRGCSYSRAAEKKRSRKPVCSRSPPYSLGPDRSGTRSPQDGRRGVCMRKTAARKGKTMLV